ncbi:ABC transporter ATP-binding protein [Seonamhaeicola sp.]|uniref:ABC transporter ATP-binding protein n=1 Tax=Seonamhaeicola sp. TaxID=1912245 RepID=UPI0026307561|nr:ABC transporter ATP-binding protein [Seonamhaeicola sp.]
MDDVILKIENLSKQYRLGLVGANTIKDDLKRWWYGIRGKEDPFLKIAEENNRKEKGGSNYVWALQDINFEVKQGEVLGIIGKNGAGKSTLLKILSKITSPTTGSVKSKGTVASLLEVGTGFHSELTGRENIYLNGAILGMTKKEIASKIDEIIEFSGCQRYIDTPVKRYSSGMTVRLAFAVAAFLEPDILIIDEVLTVGDAEFQKKAIGKMQDISKGEGRTVLFVSHNMAAVESLCTRVLLLRNGKIFSEGTPTEAINTYLSSYSFSKRIQDFEAENNIPTQNGISLYYAAVENASASKKTEIIDITSDIDICFRIKNDTKESTLSVGYDLKNTRDQVIFGSGSKFECPVNKVSEVSCRIPAQFLNDDVYQIHLYVHSASMITLFSDTEILSFEVKDVKRESGYLGKINGLIRPNFDWSLKTY